jgi:hypothetical protein
MKAKFVVQHDVLSGLKYLQVVKRKGIRVSKAQEMIVSQSKSIRRRLRVAYIDLGMTPGLLCTEHGRKADL